MKSFKLALYLNYFVYAILLNSVGIVILKSINNYGVSKIDASTLELFKDLPIAIVSFAVASFLPRLGYKKSMMVALASVSLGLLQMYLGNSFLSSQILFATVGASFALIKVSVYASIGLLTENEQQHNGLMSSIEGVFMFGIAIAYFLFPAFNSEENPDAWLNVYLVLMGIVGLAFLFLFKVPELKMEPVNSSLNSDFKSMVGLMSQLLVIVFIFSALFFVMVEQGIMTWLPTFNEKVLNLSESNSIRMASILAISLGVGRLVAGKLAERFHWSYVLAFVIQAAMAMVAFALPSAINSQLDPDQWTLFGFPLIAFLFPLIGLLIAPIYPLLNSAVLSALPKNLHSPMTGLIVIFSAIGGTVGSRITGYYFETLGGSAFYITLIPMALLLIAVFILKRLTSNA